MTYRKYFENWQSYLTQLISVAKIGGQTAPDIVVSKPEIIIVRDKDPLIHFEVYQKSLNSQHQLFMVYPRNHLGFDDCRCLVYCAESPLPPGFHINAYVTPSFVALGRSGVSIYVSIPRKEVLDRLPTKFELAILIGYNYYLPHLNVFDDQPSQAKTAWKELNRILDWQQLAVFLFEID